MSKEHNDVPTVYPAHTHTRAHTRPTQSRTLPPANKSLPSPISRTLATSVVWLERDEGEGGMDGRCPPPFLTKGWQARGNDGGVEAEGED